MNTVCVLCESEHAIIKSFQLISFLIIPPTYQSVSFYVNSKDEKKICQIFFYFEQIILVRMLIWQTKKKEWEACYSPSSLSEKIIILGETVNN